MSPSVPQPGRLFIATQYFRLFFARAFVTPLGKGNLGLSYFATVSVRAQWCQFFLFLSRAGPFNVELKNGFE